MEPNIEASGDDMKYEEIEDLESQLQHKKEKYLEQRGWERKCDLPGSYWYWEREYNNKNIVMPLNEAVKLQFRINNWEDTEETKWINVYYSDHHRNGLYGHDVYYDSEEEAKQYLVDNKIGNCIETRRYT